MSYLKCTKSVQHSLFAVFILIDANQCLNLTDTTSGSKYFTQDPDMNPGLCFQICRGLKMPISAVNIVTCHCYLTMPQHSVLNWTECSKYCNSNNYQNCGGGQNIFFVTKGNKNDQDIFHFLTAEYLSFLIFLMPPSPGRRRSRVSTYVFLLLSMNYHDSFRKILD